MFRLIFAAACLALVVFIQGCASDSEIPKSDMAEKTTTSYTNPAEAFGELFVAIQMSEIFEDSKTFVDMSAKSSVEDILAAYDKEKDGEKFQLAEFVTRNFNPPVSVTNDFHSNPEKNLDEHIESLWPVLTRDQAAQGEGSLIPLPHDYVVPGGRFREVYYWDSYFTMLGLLVDGQEAYAKRMVDNFAWLIDEVGFIPNGNRAYYLSRSQPPFFAPMVGLLQERMGDTIVDQYLPQLEKEYAFWMREQELLDEPGDRRLRVAKLPGDFLVNRYFDEDPRPRPEGFREDSLLLVESNREAVDLYSNLRAACESGWDFSSRWLSDPSDLGTIRTASIAPVCLNSLLYYLEDLLANAYARKGDSSKQQAYASSAYERRRAVISAFWDPELKWFSDYDIEEGKPTGEATLAGMYPLFFGLATDEQATAAAERLELDFLKPGGLVTSLRNSGQQWDAPNGWPPLQWISIAGLRAYGHDQLAKTIASRWIASGRKVYRQTGKVTEKYNVVDTTLHAGGGEYPNQDGFGWSNGVFARIIEDYPGI